MTIKASPEQNPTITIDINDIFTNSALKTNDIFTISAVKTMA